MYRTEPCNVPLSLSWNLVELPANISYAEGEVIKDGPGRDLAHLSAVYVPTSAFRLQSWRDGIKAFNDGRHL